MYRIFSRIAHSNCNAQKNALANTVYSPLLAFVSRGLNGVLLSPSAAYTTRNATSATNSSKSESHLAKALKMELDYEKKNPIDMDVKEALEKTWRIQQSPGTTEIMLTKKLGKEEIKVIFNANSIMNEDLDAEDDLAAEEDMESLTESERASLKEDFLDEKDEEGDEDESISLFNETDFRVIISKEGVQGASIFECSAGADDFEVHRIKHVPNVNLALDNSAEAEMNLFKVYDGPEFSTLDPKVRDAVYEYLEARGITRDEFSAQISELTMIKEQEEYQNWLQNMYNFISAK